jgi:ubiquinone biosynthesis protein Coq4
VRFIADQEVAYAAQRSREVHDLWHVLFGCHTNVFGELALKAVEYVQVCILCPPEHVTMLVTDRRAHRLTDWHAPKHKKF